MTNYIGNYDTEAELLARINDELSLEKLLHLVAEKDAEIDALQARNAFLEAEFAKELKPVFDVRGKAINLIRI